jgi:hypothetical protein
LDSEEGLRRHIQAFMVRLLYAVDRLNITVPAPNVDFRKEAPQHPVHYLYMDEALELTFSADFRRAFGADLIVDHFAGAVVPLLVGERPPRPVSGDRLSPEYRQALAGLPRLESQGDGMRSFVGTLLWARVSDFRVLLIDEPEAFLHPPQARLMGRVLSRTKRPYTQVIAATHSGDFLRGALDAQVGNLRVIRVTRRGSVNVARELNPTVLRDLWSDPLIRYSNLLDALFHQQCVICESEGDCLFYAGVLQTIVDAAPDQPIPEVMFASVGGKARMAKAIRALVDLNIAVRAIADFDVLRDEQPIKDIAESLGIAWSAIAANWKVVSTAISGRKAQLDTRDTKARIHATLDAVAADYIPEGALRDIRDITRKASSWSEAKAIGEPFIPPGEAVQRYDQLKSALGARGIFIVPVGELEGFDRSIPGHSTKWLGAVMQKDLSTPAFDSARAFVRAVIG